MHIIPLLGDLAAQRSWTFQKEPRKVYQPLQTGLAVANRGNYYKNNEAFKDKDGDGEPGNF